MSLLQETLSVHSEEADEDGKSVNSSSNHSGTGTGTGNDDKDQTSTSDSSGSNFLNKIAKKEHLAVVRSKALVLFVLFLVAASFAAATFFFTKNAETGDFRIK